MQYSKNYMSLYRMTNNKLEPLERTTFAAANVLERRDLQRLLRHDISIIGQDLMVIAEEYGDWEDSNRRIDLLCLSKDACLVVVEIKRTEDGGHMELQAIRYAAMVSSMTLDQVIHAYATNNTGDIDEARSEIHAFLKYEGEGDLELSGDVRIILASADFSTELTTAVIWLNKRNLNVTCVRMRPYQLEGDILIEATQIIPLPEAADYEVKMRAQEYEKKKVVSKRQEIFRRFWAQLIERSKERTRLLVNRSSSDAHWLSAGIGRSGFTLSLVLIQESSFVECYIRIGKDAEKTLSAFEALREQRSMIETAFGCSLDWQDLPGKLGCRICHELPGGWKAPESDWPELHERMIDALIRLDDALRKPIQELDI
jgi:hypothetical protein